MGFHCCRAGLWWYCWFMVLFTSCFHSDIMSHRVLDRKTERKFLRCRRSRDRSFLFYCLRFGPEFVSFECGIKRRLGFMKEVWDIVALTLKSFVIAGALLIWLVRPSARSPEHYYRYLRLSSSRIRTFPIRVNPRTVSSVKRSRAISARCRYTSLESTVPDGNESNFPFY